MDKIVNTKDRNATWQRNHDEIQAAFIELYNETGSVPTITAVSDRAGFSRQVVADHMKEISISDVTPKYKMLNDRVFESLSKSAIAGDVRAMKLYFQIVMSWNEKKQIDHRQVTQTISVQYGDKKDDTDEIVAEVID